MLRLDPTAYGTRDASGDIPVPYQKLKPTSKLKRLWQLIRRKWIALRHRGYLLQLAKNELPFKPLLLQLALHGDIPLTQHFILRIQKRLATAVKYSALATGEVISITFVCSYKEDLEWLLANRAIQLAYEPTQDWAACTSPLWELPADDQTKYMRLPSLYPPGFIDQLVRKHHGKERPGVPDSLN